MREIGDPVLETPQEIGAATRYIDLGACLSIAGMPDQAASLYRMALRAEPGNPLAHRALLALDRRAAKLCLTNHIPSPPSKH